MNDNGSMIRDSCPQSCNFCQKYISVTPSACEPANHFLTVIELSRGKVRNTQFILVNIMCNKRMQYGKFIISVYECDDY